MFCFFPCCPSDLYILADARSGIGSDEAIHSDHVHALVLGIGATARAAVDRDLLFPLHPGAGIDLLHELVAHPHYALPYVA